MKKKPQALFLTFFIGMVVAASALILSIPPLFDPDGSNQMWVTGVLGFLTLALGVSAKNIRMRSNDPNAGG